MHVKEYVSKIVEGGNKEQMKELSDMLEETMHKLKEYDEEFYMEEKMELYEMAYGKTLSEDMAIEWVANMVPVHEYWTIEQTTAKMKELGYNLDRIQYYTVANMMINDYHETLKDNPEVALKMANEWLKDADAVDNKLYEYWKYIAK